MFKKIHIPEAQQCSEQKGAKALLQLRPLSLILMGPEGQCWVLHPGCGGSHKNRPREIESTGSSVIGTRKVGAGGMIWGICLNPSALTCSYTTGLKSCRYLGAGVRLEPRTLPQSRAHLFKVMYLLATTLPLVQPTFIGPTR